MTRLDVGRRPWWSVGRADHHRTITVIGCLGLLAGVLMARLGLPPLDLHGPLHHLGIMDPFCGGTRSAYFALRGRGDQAWTYNPLGVVAVLAAPVAAARAVAGTLTGLWLNVDFRWSRTQRRVVIAFILVAMILLEVRQQSIAPLLMAA